MPSRPKYLHPGVVYYLFTYYLQAQYTVFVWYNSIIETAVIDIYCENKC